MRGASRLHIEILAPLGFALAASLWASTAAEAQAGWRMFRGDLRHSGFADTDAPADSMLAWRYDGPDSIANSSPVLAADGTIYIGNTDRELLALWPVGTLRWQFKAAGNFRHSTPAVAPDGTIYVGGSDGRLYAIRPDGTLRWTFSANAGIRTSPNLGPDGTIYFGADNGRVYAVRPDSTLLWSYPTGGDSLRSSPAIGPEGNVYIGGTDNYLYALWPNGTLRWRALTGGPLRVNCPTVDTAGNVYCGSSDGFVYSFSAAGSFRWARFLDLGLRTSVALGINGLLYIGSGNDFYALRDHDGNIEWNRSLSGDIEGSPAYLLDDDVVCIGTDAGVFYVLHAQDGELDWRFSTGASLLGSPAPSPQGNIYAADILGRIWAFGIMPTIGVPPAAPGPGPSVRVLPNPARGWVRFEIATGRQTALQPVRIVIHDVAGRQVRALQSDQGAVTWDRRDSRGRVAPAGLYIYRIAGSAISGRFLILD
jgi:large repetitive protein